MTRPLPAYQSLVEDGTLDPDPAQEQAAIALQSIADTLRGYQPGRRRSLFRKSVPRPRGLYMWGGVGVGKSLLMDLFIETVPIREKRRVHFHAFMQEVHRFIATWRQMDDPTRRRHPARLKSADLDDPIPHAAKAVFARAHLFCFDEVQVTDITDAMLLGRLFETLFELGAVIVATSNRHPDDLYKNGLNRQLFLPSIALLKANLDILELVGAKDYRLDRLSAASVYFSPLGPEADKAMNKAWHAMTAGAAAQQEQFTVAGREVIVPAAARGVARGSFAHWCGSALGPADYLCLAAEYPTIFIDHIPQMSPANRNEAKRFVTLIDALYEARCKLVCSAAAAPDDLYPTGDGAFEFGRTASRLHEMQSENYLQLPHEGTHPATLETSDPEIATV